MSSKKPRKSVDKRMYVYVDCPAALFPLMTTVLQTLAEKKHTIIAVVGNTIPFDDRIQRSIRDAINHVCQSGDATQSDWLEAVNLWQKKCGHTHNMQVVRFVKREEGCEVG